MLVSSNRFVGNSAKALFTPEKEQIATILSAYIVPCGFSGVYWSILKFITIYGKNIDFSV